MTKAEPIWALGAMSGTSLDGVDAAMILTDGVEVFEFGKSAYRAYSDTEQSVLRAALGKWDGSEVDAAAEVVELAHAELLAESHLGGLMARIQPSPCSSIRSIDNVAKNPAPTGLRHHLTTR
jgi:1,6-anhydro-N-acetylmuramate kinase